MDRNWQEWAEQHSEAAAERDRLRKVLTQIADASYVGNYSNAEVVVIYREWARNALV